MIQPKYKYDWTIKDTIFTKDKGKVFSCFACGGGSSFGYKLAGFDVIGCNEIDPRMVEVYKANHNPKYVYCEPIQTFKLRNDLPKELYTLDILDGSPPCSTFSTSGNREKDWGKERTFKEGQAKQVLDTLFFDFIDLAKKLQPKVVIAENVKGLLLGKAYKYVTHIYEEFDNAGYYCSHFLLDASKMNVPQKRERVFFVCLRKDLAKPFLYQHNLFEERPFLDMEFVGNPICIDDFVDYQGRDITGKETLKYWKLKEYGDVSVGDTKIRLGEKLNNFNTLYLYKEKPSNTLTTRESSFLHFDKPKHLSKNEILNISSFPKDYDFKGRHPMYICGMSVPPVMMANIATEIYRQWLSKINKEDK